MSSTDVDTWMPFYVADYLRDTRHLSATEHGAYMLLIMQAWTQGGLLPLDPVRLARIAGLITGASDYLFLWDGGSGVLEAKSKTGSLTPSQKDWRDWCQANGVRHAVFRSVDEGEAQLRSWGVLA